MRGAIGSLNAAVAGSILLFEAVAQRDPGSRAEAKAVPVEASPTTGTTPTAETPTDAPPKTGSIGGPQDRRGARPPPGERPMNSRLPPRKRLSGAGARAAPWGMATPSEPPVEVLRYAAFTDDRPGRQPGRRRARRPRPDRRARCWPSRPRSATRRPRSSPPRGDGGSPCATSARWPRCRSAATPRSPPRVALAERVGAGRLRAATPRPARSPVDTGARRRRR